MENDLEAYLAELEAADAADEEALEVLGLELSQLQSQQPAGLWA